jgi:hypothetical protein
MVSMQRRRGARRWYPPLHVVKHALRRRAKPHHSEARVKWGHLGTLSRPGEAQIGHAAGISARWACSSRGFTLLPCTTAALGRAWPGSQRYALAKRLADDLRD